MTVRITILPDHLIVLTLPEDLDESAIAAAVLSAVKASGHVLSPDIEAFDHSTSINRRRG